MRIKNVRRLALGIIPAYAALVGGLLTVMHQSVLFGRVMAKLPEFVMMLVPFRHLWFIARTGHLRVGDLAPNFALRSSDKKVRVELAAFRGGRPVVLIFGSYT